MTNNNFEAQRNNPPVNDEIDLNSFSRVFIRNKKLILYLSICGVFISSLFAFIPKKTWQGEFQIVLEKKEEKNKQSSLISLQGLGKSRDMLSTEVEILKSPFLLLSIFDFLKEQKISKNDNSLKDVRFKDWKKKNLKIALEPKTSVLNIAYIDQDKDLILPVLRKISKGYQIYSGERRLRNIQLGIDFFEEQIPIYKEKSIESLKKAQEFAIKQDLSLLSGDTAIDKEIPNSINIEEIRLEAATNIRNVDLQLIQLEKLGKDPEKLMYLGRTIPGLVAEGLPGELDRIDRVLADLNNLKKQLTDIGNDPVKLEYIGIKIPQLQETGLPEKLKDIAFEIGVKKEIYTEKDKSIQDLLKERDLLIKILRERAIAYIDSDINELENSKPILIDLLKTKAKSFLEASKLAAQTQLKIAERPEGVIIEYKQLLNNAGKNKATLEKLEDQYRKLLLDKARTEDPWQLITKPTLLESPVAPNKKRIILLGLFMGFGLGSIISFIIDKKEDIIYESDSIFDEFGTQVLADVRIKNKKNILESITLINSSMLSKIDKEIAMIPVGEINDKVINKIQNAFEESTEKRISLIKKFTDSSSIENIIILIGLGITKRKELFELINFIQIYNKNKIGIISISDLEIDNKSNSEDLIEKIIINLKILISSLKNEINVLRSVLTKNNLQSKLNKYIKIMKNNHK